VRRELWEELGASIATAGRVFLASSPSDAGLAVQHFFLARLTWLDESARSGPELDDPSRGGYDLDRVDLRGDDLERIDLKPTVLKEFILANREVLLTTAVTMNSPVTEIIVRAVIRRDDQILLARQRTRSWSFLPGGHVEPGERVEAALVRELAEELATEATIVGFDGVVEHGYVENDITHHELNVVFEVDIANGKPVSQEDHLEFHWLPLGQLADADVRPELLKTALVVTGEGSLPFWRGENG
jgi:8-oxo-dGTP pyrophosphatase MutT (NUDIX family)